MARNPKLLSSVKIVDAKEDTLYPFAEIDAMRYGICGDFRMSWMLMQQFSIR